MSLNKIPWWGYGIAVVVIVAVVGAIEYYMGRVLICGCGQIKFWYGVVSSSENSQHIADWYSFSHIIHGIFFYGFFRLVSRGRWALGLCLVFAVLVESGWELLENSSFIIDRYREGTISLDYYGDSVLNSVSDILFSVGGFFLAAFVPVWVSVALVVGMEVGVGYMIRDNLTLNIIMLVHPIDAIKVWQMGG